MKTPHILTLQRYACLDRSGLTTVLRVCSGSLASSSLRLSWPEFSRTIRVDTRSLSTFSASTTKCSRTKSIQIHPMMVRFYFQVNQVINDVLLWKGLWGLGSASSAVRGSTTSTKNTHFNSNFIILLLFKDLPVVLFIPFIQILIFMQCFNSHFPVTCTYSIVELIRSWFALIS